MGAAGRGGRPAGRQPRARQGGSSFGRSRRGLTSHTRAARGSAASPPLSPRHLSASLAFSAGQFTQGDTAASAEHEYEPAGSPDGHRQRDSSENGSDKVRRHAASPAPCRAVNARSLLDAHPTRLSPNHTTKPIAHAARPSHRLSLSPPTRLANRATSTTGGHGSTTSCLAPPRKARPPRPRVRAPRPHARRCTRSAR